MDNKWRSRRWLITVWAVGMVTVIIGWAMISGKSPTWIGIAIGLFQLIIVGFIASDTVDKTKGK